MSNPDWKGAGTRNIAWPANAMRFEIYQQGASRPKVYSSKDNECPSNFIKRILTEEDGPNARMNGTSVATTLAAELKKMSYPAQLALPLQLGERRGRGRGTSAKMEEIGDEQHG